MRCHICGKATERTVSVGGVKYPLCDKCREDVEKFSGLCKEYIAAEEGA